VRDRAPSNARLSTSDGQQIEVEASGGVIDRRRDLLFTQSGWRRLRGNALLPSSVGHRRRQN